MYNALANSLAEAFKQDLMQYSQEGGESFKEGLT